MWPIARRRRGVSPPFYNSYDSLDLYRNYPGFDATPPSYPYSYRLAYGLGLNEYMPATQSVELATRQHVTAQKEFEKAKEKFEEAEKVLKECETKMKQADELLRAAKCAAMYSS
jgi:hypothetical protein